MNKALDTGGDSIDADADMANAARDAAMGKGEEEVSVGGRGEGERVCVSNENVVQRIHRPPHTSHPSSSHFTPVLRSLHT